MKRRTVLSVIAAYAALPRAYAQQSPAPPRIAYLASAGGIERVDAFTAALRDAGYIVGKTIALDFRSAGGDHSRHSALARELVALQPKIIVTAGTPATRAAQRETTTIPIVFIGAGDPVGTKLVKSLARPGGNTTGFSNVSPAVMGKRLELMALIVPGLARVGVLLNAANATRDANLKGITDTARLRGIAVVPLDVRTAQDIEKAFGVAAQERLNALIVQADNLFLQQLTQLTALAAKAMLPTCYSAPEYVVAGGLVSYAHSRNAQLRSAALYVDKILKGTAPADLPVQQPTIFELVVNLKTARALGLTVPQAILVSADRVIE